MAGSGGLWIALSGFWLLVTSFRLGEFVPKRWRPARELTVFDPDGTKLRSVESHTGDSIYLALRSEEHTSELQSLMRSSYAVFCLKKKTKYYNNYMVADTTIS